MAGKSDGSITIDTKLDNSGFSKGSDELKHAVKSLTDQVNETGSKIQNAFKFDFGSRSMMKFRVLESLDRERWKVMRMHWHGSGLKAGKP